MALDRVSHSTAVTRAPATPPQPSCRLHAVSTRRAAMKGPHSGGGGRVGPTGARATIPVPWTTGRGPSPGSTPSTTRAPRPSATGLCARLKWMMVSVKRAKVAAAEVLVLKSGGYHWQGSAVSLPARK